ALQVSQTSKGRQLGKEQLVVEQAGPNGHATDQGKSAEKHFKLEVSVSSGCLALYSSGGIQFINDKNPNMSFQIQAIVTCLWSMARHAEG
ncbi:hypothetical protein OFM52_30055, partial [Escherichia coli]|nr:hypothetical protein [Escherichia coli]